MNDHCSILGLNVLLIRSRACVAVRPSKEEIRDKSLFNVHSGWLFTNKNSRPREQYALSNYESREMGQETEKETISRPEQSCLAADFR